MSAAGSLRGAGRGARRLAGPPAAHTACAAAIALLALTSPGCGRKTPVRPPAHVAPAAITDLAASSVGGGVALRWERPRRNAGGEHLADLDAFVVERALPGLPFALLARIQVPDRDKLRQQKRFTFVDESALLGEAYRYRVFAVTLDGYFSAPSNVVEVVRQPPPAATPAAAP